MKDVGQRGAEVAALKHAIPYVRMFKGKTFVVKLGGETIADETRFRGLIEQVDALHQVGIRVVLVHGGGPQSTALATALGIPTRMVDGRRVTDERNLEVSIMTLNGQLNTRILGMCRAFGLPAVGLSGIDAGLVRAKKRPPVSTSDGEEVDFGWVGDIQAIEPAILASLLEKGFLPVLSSLGADENGQVLNINADTVAAALAVALGAEKLILVTGAPGILENLEDARSLISYTDLEGLDELRRKGSLSGGMKPKADAVEAAIKGGVKRVHLIPWNVQDSLLIEIFTNEGIGTLVVEDIDALSDAEQAAG
jgi:acetylglutamate kinase